MAYSIEGSSHACYEGTLCLVNKLDIRDEAVLETFESDITVMKAAALEAHPLPGAFDFAHYKQIHQYLFEDIYDCDRDFLTIATIQAANGVLDHLRQFFAESIREG